MELLKRIMRSRSIINSFWIIGEQIFQMGMSLIVGVLTARYLGPSNYGALSYTASFVSFAMSFATLGMEGVIIKKMIAHPEEEASYLGSCIRLRCISTFMAAILVTLTVALLNPGNQLKLILVSLQSLQLVFRSIQLLDAWFQRHLKSKYVSLGKMVACIVVSGYKIFLLATAKSIVWFAFSNSLTDLVISVMLIYWYRREKAQPLRVQAGKGKEVLSESYHFIISGVMTAIFTQMDRIMIGGIAEKPFECME